MTMCPGCSANLSSDFLEEVMDDLSTIGIAGDKWYMAPCCPTRIKGRVGLGMYYLVLEQANGSETEVLIGAK